MGAFDSTPKDDIPTQPAPIDNVVVVEEVDKVSPEQGAFDSTIRDSHYHQIRHYLNDLDGTTVTLQFYHLIGGSVDAPSIVGLLDNQYTHQYKYIRNLKAKLPTGNINFQKDAETGISNLAGTLQFYPGFTPSKYDIFFLEVSDHRKMAFYLTNVEELGYSRNRVVEAEFSLLGDATDELVEGMDERVIETVVFDKRFLSTNPFLTVEAVNYLSKLIQLRDTLIDDYFRHFYNRGLLTIALEHDGRLIYDDLLCNCVRSTIPDYSKHSHVQINQYSIGYQYPPKTIWSLLTQSSKFKTQIDLPNINSSAVLVPCGVLPTLLDQRTLKFTEVTHFVWMENEPHVYLSDNVIKTQCKPLPSSAPNSSSETPQEDKGDKADNDKENTVSASYALHSSFYNNEISAMTDLECLVFKMLQGGNIGPKELFTVIDEVKANSNQIEMFYQYPLCWMLCNYLTR